eukprot:577233-Rhodomonas_salina.1
MPLPVLATMSAISAGVSFLAHESVLAEALATRARERGERSQRPGLGARTAEWWLSAPIPLAVMTGFTLPSGGQSCFCRCRDWDAATGARRGLHARPP